MGCAWLSITIGVLSSLLATCLWALLAARARRRNAKRFVGWYEMHGQPPQMDPLHIRVRIDYEGSWWRDVVDQSVLLEIFAECGENHKAPGRVEFTGSLEVLGLSGVASGFFQYRDREGGALRLVLSEDPESIIEHAIPYDPKYPPFQYILKRKHVEEKRMR